MPLSSETLGYQQKFAEFCRGRPFSTEVPGLSARISGVYQNLIHGGVEQILRSAYPIAFADLSTRSLAERNVWSELVDRFILSHSSQTPYFWKVPKEFLNYVRELKLTDTNQLPYLCDLLEFELSEIEIFMMPDLEISATDRKESKDCGKIELLRESKILHLTYPVFKVIGDANLAQRSDYFILIFRHPETLQVRFVELGALHAMLLDRLAQQKMTKEELLVTAKNAFTEADLHQVMEGELTKLLDLLSAEKAIRFI